jgi:hypothetical protein
MVREELKQEAKRSCIDKTHYCIGGFGGNAYCEGYIDSAEPREKRIAELEKENAELKEKISDVLECFVSSSSGDDFEMAESAREVMEVLSIPCYRHGEVKSKLTKAKELLNEFMRISKASDEDFEHDYTEFIAEAEQFISKEK